MTGEEEEAVQPRPPGLRPDAHLEQIAEQLRALAAANDRLQGLLDAVRARTGAPQATFPRC